MTIFERRQLEARMALAMDDLSKDEGGEVVKTDNGYDWIADNGEVIISMRNI